MYRSFTRDELLANVTLYWMTQTISSSFLMYHEGRNPPHRFTSDDFVHVPCAIARFPKEILFPPQEWVERGYNVQRWTEMPMVGTSPLPNNQISWQGISVRANGLHIFNWCPLGNCAPSFLLKAGFASRWTGFVSAGRRR